jgi:hypothetical protein
MAEALNTPTTSYTKWETEKGKNSRRVPGIFWVAIEEVKRKLKRRK